MIEWFYGNVANRIRGGYLRAFSQFIGQIPIPPTDTDQQRLCELLSDALTWLHRPPAKAAKDVQIGLMSAYLEQWLNGLVYELFFPDELHARKLKLFAETAKLNPPELGRLSDTNKMSRLREVFEKAYDSNAPLRGSLFDLRSLESVRIIEDSSRESAATVAKEVE